MRADTRQRGQTEVNDALIGARWLSDGAVTITLPGTYLTAALTPDPDDALGSGQLA